MIDLSCRRHGGDKWFVAMDKWQTITDMEVCEGNPSTPDYSIVSGSSARPALTLSPLLRIH